MPANPAPLPDLNHGTWLLFRDAVEAAGGQARYFRQRQWANWNGGIVGRQHGYCGPLTVKWIRDAKLSVDFVLDAYGSEGREEIVQETIDQFRMKTDILKYIEEALRCAALIKRGTFTIWLSANWASEVAEIIAAQPGYYYLQFEGSLLQGAQLGQLSHAVGFDGYTRSFFDSNAGEATFSSPKAMAAGFKRWGGSAYRLVAQQKILLQCFT